MIPETIEIAPLHCTVCREPIPASRAQRQTATCSEKCKDKLDAIRARQRAARKCSVCLHPSTPEERELFREWRASRGDISTAVRQERDGSPDKKTLRAALREAVDALEAVTPHPEASDAENAPPRPGNGHSGEGLNALILRLKELTRVPRAKNERKSEGSSDGPDSHREVDPGASGG